MDSRLYLPSDSVLDDSYRITRVVGSGGFGITYEADDVNLGNTVAIKEYYPVDFADRDASLSVLPISERHRPTFDWGRANFMDEARTLVRLEHPSIVRVSRVFEANSTAYMVMRFEHGLSFGSWLASRDLPPSQAKLDSIIAPLLDALEAMHAASILHRDIAPDNIIIRPDGTPVLLDFGAARRVIAAQSRAVRSIVKAGYSPNEQYASDTSLQGAWSDIYALGATLYRAVTGRTPEEATLRMIDDCMPPAAQSARGDYRPDFLAAIDSCLEVDPRDRPQSVAEIRPLLLGTQETERRVGTVWGKVPAHGQRWMIALCASVVVMGFIHSGFGYLHARSKADVGATGSKSVQAKTPARAQEEALAHAHAEAKRREEESLAAEKRAAEERARQEAEAKRQAAAAAKKETERAEVPKGAFDGAWEIVGLGGQRCRFKNWKAQISIENNRIVVPSLPPGRVNEAGEFRFNYIAVGLPDAPPGVFSGKLAGNSGSGRYNYSNFCLGSLRLNRI